MKHKNEEYPYVFGVSQKIVFYDPKEKKFLLAKCDKDHLFEEYGPWDLIGGTLNLHEDLDKSLEREIKEEVSEIEYRIIDLIASEKVKRNDGKEKIILQFLAEFLGGEIKLSKEHLEYRWEKYEDIIKNDEYKPWIKNVIEKAQKYIESQEYLDGWKRCQADFENYKKMQAEAQKDLIKYSTENVVMQLIPVLDNFHMSTDHVPEDQKNGGWVIGIMHIQKQLENVLAENGVEEIPTKEGNKFDPTIHEAVSDSNDSNKNLNDSGVPKIKKVLLKGYKMGGKIIRPVKVIVE